MVGQELVVGEDCGLLKVHHAAVLHTKVSQVELGLDVVQLVKDVDVGPAGLHPVQDVGLEFL